MRLARFVLLVGLLPACLDDFDFFEAVDGGLDAGFDGGKSWCGEELFQCPSGALCPISSVCGGVEAGCSCGEGLLAVDCSNTPCPESGCDDYIDKPQFTCAPRKAGVCGGLNFTVACPSGAYCPSNSSCSASGACECALGYVAVSCDSDEYNPTPCSAAGADCADFNWWCQPRKTGGCGAPYNTVECATASGGDYYCPSDSTCDGNGSCQCITGTLAYSCDRNAAVSLCKSIDGGCGANSWGCFQPPG